MPDDRPLRDASSRRAFSMAPAASTNVPARTVNRLPANVPARSRTAVRCDGSISISSALAWSRSRTFVARSSAGWYSCPNRVGPREIAYPRPRARASVRGSRPARSSVPGRTRTARACMPRARARAGHQRVRAKGQPLCGSQSRAAKSIGSSGRHSRPGVRRAAQISDTHGEARNTGCPVVAPRYSPAADQHRVAPSSL